MFRYLPLLLLLLLPAVAMGQTAEVVTQVDAKLDAERAAQRNEDVEILRRLLNKACGLPDKVSVSVSEQSVQRTGDARDALRGGNAPVTVQVARYNAAVGPFDGVYLPGAGAVYTLHVPAGVPRTVQGERIGLNSSCNTCHQPQVHVSLPSPVSVSACTSCHSELPKTPALLSDWDRTRMDVRGEKPKEPVVKPKDDKTVAVCEPGSLNNLIGGVLAANARNVRHLGEKEGVTVVVTFDGVTEKPAAVSVAAPAKPAFQPEEVKALTLGDLHLKAGKYAEAAEAYAEGLVRFGDKEWPIWSMSGTTAEQRKQYAEELQKGVRDAMKSYAKALLLADQPDKAKWALGMATGFVVTDATPAAVPAKTTAPAKLVITVSKADLDAAKDAAAVKKAVKTERVNFPAEAKK